MCSICLDSMYSRTIKTPCNHSFHFGCLKRAIRHNTRCPLCRQELQRNWLLQHRLVLTCREYWVKVEGSFGVAPHIGPLIPSQQRQYDASMGYIQQPPSWWSRLWIADRQAEMRMRLPIPPDYPLTSQDVRICEENGMVHNEPEWTLPTWVHYLD